LLKRNSIFTFLALLTFSVHASAQVPDARTWVDVNFGVAGSAANEEEFAFGGRLFGEPAALAVAYPTPSRGGSFDFGGGYMLTEVVGFGVSVSGAAHEDAAGLAVVIPHPFFFNASTTASAVTDGALSRAEGGAHLQVMFAPLHTDTVRVRLFGGPTFFRYQADMVQDIEYLQTATAFSRANLVTVTGVETVETEGTGWGFNLGGDASYFFTRVFGVGGFARFSRGSVLVNEPMSGEDHDMKVGGLQAGGGLRLRF
jgi:hypothetical protein